MSRQNEEAYEKWRKVHDEECRRDLVIGAKVYRAGYDKVEEGEVKSIARVRYVESYFGSPREVEDPEGLYTRYTACFGSDWEHQTYQWAFFFNIADARKTLAQKLRDRAKEHRDDAARCDALAASFEAP